MWSWVGIISRYTVLWFAWNATTLKVNYRINMQHDWYVVLQNGIVFLSDVTYELQSINPRLCQYRCDNDNENAFVLKRAPTINHTWTDGFGSYLLSYKYIIFIRKNVWIPLHWKKMEGILKTNGGTFYILNISFWQKNNNKFFFKYERLLKINNFVEL